MRALLALCLVGIFGAVAHAHPIHTAFAEADYNSATKRLEVTLRVFADDFEHALGQLAGAKISLEKSPPAELDALTRAYLVSHFMVKSRDGSLAPQRWTGRELKGADNELWLYFEVELPAGVDGIRVTYSVLQSLHADQLNSLRVRDGARSLTLVFPPTQGERTVRFRP